MGMFDSFNLEVDCPFCKKKELIEFQTKQFDCCMYMWQKGDLFCPNGIVIEKGIIKGVYGNCSSNKAMKWEKRYSKNTVGFGRPLECDIVIRNNKVAHATNIRLSKRQE